MTVLRPGQDETTLFAFQSNTLHASHVHVVLEQPDEGLVFGGLVAKDAEQLCPGFYDWRIRICALPGDNTVAFLLFSSGIVRYVSVKLAILYLVVDVITVAHVFCDHVALDFQLCAVPGA